MSKYGYLELFFEGPFDFEITRVDCIINKSSIFLCPISSNYVFRQNLVKMGVSTYYFEIST